MIYESQIFLFCTIYTNYNLVEFEGNLATNLKPYNITFAAALILQDTNGTNPTVGVSFSESRKNPTKHNIAYGVHANSHTIINLKVIFASIQPDRTY